MLTGSELDRYKRQMGIDGWGVDAQMKLKKSTVFVAGAGGLGAPVLFYLAAAGVGTVRICDFDTVDISNLNRQILHRETSIGKKKISSALETIRALNSTISITGFDEKIDNTNADALVSGADIVVDCLDTFSARHLLNRACVSQSIPFVHAGVAEFQGQISFFHSPTTPCFACIFPESESPLRPSIAGATAGVLGSLAALEVIKYLTGIGGTLENTLLFFDGASMKCEHIKIFKKKDCHVCS